MAEPLDEVPDDAVVLPGGTLPLLAVVVDVDPGSTPVVGLSESEPVPDGSPTFPGPHATAEQIRTR